MGRRQKRERELEQKKAERSKRIKLICATSVYMLALFVMSVIVGYALYSKVFVNM
jgi:hypothetical protein